jgi:nitroreductase
MEKTQDLYAEIFKRKSIRRFTDKLLDTSLSGGIDAAIAETLPLSAASSAALQVFSAKEAGVSFGGAPYCLGAYAGDEKGADLNAAYMLQQMNLRLSCMGLGSCWLGMGRPKGGSLVEYQGLAFSKLIVFGFTADALHRNDSRQFKRKALTEITDIQGSDELLEAVRLAPSALNRQGWYLTQTDNKIRLFMAGNNFLVKKLLDPMTTADAGIALCHLILAARHNGSFAASYWEEDIKAVMKNYSYVWTVEVK